MFQKKKNKKRREIKTGMTDFIINFVICYKREAQSPDARRENYFVLPLRGGEPNCGKL